jgi:hypothetical protein
MKTKAFVGKEKERVPLGDGSPKDTSEVILPFLGFWKTATVREPIVRVKHVVTKIVKNASVELVCPGARRY